MNTTLHTVQITDCHGFRDSIAAPSKPAALALARQLYMLPEARAEHWACFLATYAKRGAYSSLEHYELIPQA